MIKTFAAASALALFASSSMAASAIDVSANIYENGVLDGTASFIGTDANSDGKLSLNELSSFGISIDGFTGNLASVNSFGNYTVATNTWASDAEAWGEYPTGAFVSWSNDTLAVTTMNGFSVVTSAVSAVPEPTMLAMMGMGALVLMARRRKSV